jgi:hypothetical protein
MQLLKAHAVCTWLNASNYWHVMSITECQGSVLYQVIKDQVGQLHFHVCFLPGDTLGVHLLCLQHQYTMLLGIKLQSDTIIDMQSNSQDATYPSQGS